MALKVSKADVWVAELVDQPGSLSSALSRLAEAGVNLQFIIARRSPEKPGSGVVFVTPIKGTKAVKAAQAAGFVKSSKIATLRIEGPDRKGLGAKITQAIAAAGVNLRGVSAGVIGKNFVCYISLDTAADAAKAAKAIRRV